LGLGFVTLIKIVGKEDEPCRRHVAETGFGVFTMNELKRILMDGLALAIKGQLDDALKKWREGLKRAAGER
jgi:hypothetical protein